MALTSYAVQIPNSLATILAVFAENGLMLKLVWKKKRSQAHTSKAPTDYFGG